MIRVGTIVQLRKSISTDRRHANVDVVMTDIEGGVKLDKKLGGFLYWNKLDLAVVRQIPLSASHSRSQSLFTPRKRSQREASKSPSL